jgi:hypothetical protein
MNSLITLFASNLAALSRLHYSCAWRRPSPSDVATGAARSCPFVSRRTAARNVMANERRPCIIGAGKRRGRASCGAAHSIAVHLPAGYREILADPAGPKHSVLGHLPKYVPSTPVVSDEVYGVRPITGDQCWLTEKCAPDDRPPIRKLGGYQAFTPTANKPGACP